MSDKFQNKYRIPSARAPWWNYGNDAAYFVTICTAGRKFYFGDVRDGKMEISGIGEIARKCWFEIPNQFSYAKMDAFVVMPNHIHGILVIDKISKSTNGRDTIYRVSNDDDTNGRDTIHRVSNNEDANIRDAINRVSMGGITGENNPMISKNLSRIIRWYKGRTTFLAHKIHPDFAWQTRFWDHIIRDDDSLHVIRNYIGKNPANWVTNQMN